MTWRWGINKIAIILIIMLALGLFVTQTGHFWRLFYPLHYQELIVDTARRYQLDPYLLAAIIYVESKFFPRARSRKGARGLMQIMPRTGDWIARELEIPEYTEDMLYDPVVNINFGAWYFSRLLEEFNHNPVMALAAYNAGSGNVKKWLREFQDRPGQDLVSFPFPETEAYVDKTFQVYRHYQQLYKLDEGLDINGQYAGLTRY